MNKQLLKAFKKSKMSNYELAAKTGISQSTIGRWVRGESDIAISYAELIAEALGLQFVLAECD